MRVTLTSRDSTVEILNKVIECDEKTLTGTEYFFEGLNQEVMQKPRKAKRLITLLSSTQAMLALMFVQSGTTYAAVKEVSPIPEDLRETILIIIAVTATLGVAIAIISLMIAGIWKMLFGENRATQWSNQILRGLTQVLAAPILVALIVSIFTLLFSNVGAFQPIVNPIATFFHR